MFLSAAIAAGLSGTFSLSAAQNAAVAQESSPTPVEEPSPEPQPSPVEAPRPKPQPSPTPVEEPSPEPESSPLLQVVGALEDGDAVLSEDGSLYDIHSFEGSSDQTIEIVVKSADFDTYLVLADAAGQILQESDDISESDTNSKIEIKLPQDGKYSAIVNGYEPSDRGSYELIVRISNAPSPSE